MNCLGENLIQMYMDGETDELTNKRIEAHLATCAACKHLYDSMREAQTFCLDIFSDYENEIEQQTDAYLEQSGWEEKPMPIPLEAYKKQKTKTQQGVKTIMKKYQKYIASAAAVGILVTGMSFEPVRASVSDVVSIFRADQIKTMDISLASLQEVEKALAEKEGEINIDNLVKVNQSGGEYKNFTSLEAAQAELGYGVTPPAGLSEQYQLGDISGSMKQDLELTLQIESVNKLMKTLGAEKLFDPSLDGKPFSIHTAPSISMTFRDQKNNKYIQYSESKMPQVIAPAGTDVNELVQCVASLGILPAEIQNQLKNMTDMGETLYIPNIDGSVKTLDINGKKVFGSFDTQSGYNYSYVTWLENGIIHVISGDFNQAEAEAWLSGK